MGKDEFLEGKKIINQAPERVNGSKNVSGRDQDIPDPRGRYGQQIDSDITEYE